MWKWHPGVRSYTKLFRLWVINTNHLKKNISRVEFKEWHQLLKPYHQSRLQHSLAVKAFTWMISFTILSPNNKSCYLLLPAVWYCTLWITYIILFSLDNSPTGRRHSPLSDWKSEVQRRGTEPAAATLPVSSRAGPQTQVCLTEVHIPCCYTQHYLVIYAQAAKLPCNFRQCLLPHQKEGKTVCKNANLPNDQFSEFSNLSMVVFSLTSNVQFWLLRLKYILNTI